MHSSARGRLADPDARERDYVLRFARNIAGRIVTAAELEEPLRGDVFDALSRKEEGAIGNRDPWGNWDWSRSGAQRQAEQSVPWLDARLASQLKLKSNPRRWPGDRQFALCLTHDVDSVSRRHTPSAAMLEATRRLAGDGSARDRAFAFAHVAAKYALQIPRLIGRRDPLWHYEDWLNLESAYGFRSTFFAFPEWVAKPHAWDANYRARDKVVFDSVRMTAGEMLRRIAERGWEVGLHGSYHSAMDAGILAGERTQVEAAIGAGVHSVRQHYLHYDATVTPGVQFAAGLRADSTQGFNRGIGFRAGTSLPYWCWDWSAGHALPLLEIPQHVMDGALLASSPDRSVDKAIAHVLQLMDEVEAVGGCLTLNWHPEYLNRPECWDVYRAVLQEAHHRQAWGCSVRDVSEWWLQRDRLLDPAARPSSTS